MSIERGSDEPAGSGPGESVAPPDFTATRHWEEVLGEGPSTKTLLSSRPVAEAIRSGSPLKVHAALEKQLSTISGTGERQRVAAILADPRRFAAPISGPPTLTTINGFGSKLMGRSHPAPDGTYVSTLCAVLLFIPLWPIRRYLVADGDRGSWYFLAQVPLSKVSRRWRLTTLAGTTALVLFVGFLIWKRTSHSDVHLVNGLDFPVQVTAGVHTVSVPSQSRAVRELPAGPLRIEARLKNGSVVEMRDVRVPGGSDVVVYNVLGAAPLYTERISYLAEGARAPSGAEDAQVQMLSGPSWVVRSGIDFAFRDAAAQVTMGGNKKVVYRTRLAVGDGGWRTTVPTLIQAGRLAQASRIAGEMARLAPEDPNTLELTFGLVAACNDVKATGALVAGMIERAPDSIVAHRCYQQFHEIHGDLEQLRARYRKAYERDPSSAAASYLYARVMPFAVAEPLVTKALASHPDDPWLLRSVAWITFQTARYAEAADAYTRLRELTPDEAGLHASYLIGALVATRRAADALAFLGELLADAPGRADRGEDAYRRGDAYELMALYHWLMNAVPDTTKYLSVEEQLRQQIRETPAPRLLSEVAALAQDRRAYDGHVKDVPAAERWFGRLTLLAREDVEKAAALSEEADPQAVASLWPAPRLAIICELQRSGLDARAKALWDQLPLALRRVLPMSLIEGLPDLGDVAEDTDATLRAVLYAAAARRETDATRKAALMSKARTCDPLGLYIP